MFVHEVAAAEAVASENGWPFGWRRTGGFCALWLSSSVIRLRLLASVRAFAAAPGASIAVPVNGRGSPASGCAEDDLAEAVVVEVLGDDERLRQAHEHALEPLGSRRHRRTAA